MAFQITISHFYVYDKEMYQGDILSWLNGVGPLLNTYLDLVPI